MSTLSLSKYSGPCRNQPGDEDAAPTGRSRHTPPSLGRHLSWDTEPGNAEQESARKACGSPGGLALARQVCEARSTVTPSLGPSQQASVPVDRQRRELRAGSSRGVMVKPRLHRGPRKGRVAR